MGTRRLMKLHGSFPTVLPLYPVITLNTTITVWNDDETITFGRGKRKPACRSPQCYVTGTEMSRLFSDVSASKWLVDESCDLDKTTKIHNHVGRCHGQTSGMFTRMKADTTMVNGENKGVQGHEERRYHKETVGICEDGTNEEVEDGLGGVF